MSFRVQPQGLQESYVQRTSPLASSRILPSPSLIVLDSEDDLFSTASIDSRIKATIDEELLSYATLPRFIATQKVAQLFKNHQIKETKSLLCLFEKARFEESMKRIENLPKNSIPIDSEGFAELKIDPKYAKVELLGHIEPQSHGVNPLLPACWNEIGLKPDITTSSSDITRVKEAFSENEEISLKEDSPLFWEGLKFPNAALACYREGSLSLNALVSSTMLFGFLKDSNIKDPSHIRLIATKTSYVYDISAIDKKLITPKQYEVFSQKEGLLPSIFLFQDQIDKCSLIIPSFLYMQNYLDRRFKENAVRLVPRWGESTKSELYDQVLKNEHVLGIDPSGTFIPDNVSIGSYGYSLHDFYHAFVISHIPLAHRKIFHALSTHLLQAALVENSPKESLKKYAWTFIDMEFPEYQYVSSYIDGIDGIFNHILNEIAVEDDSIIPYLLTALDTLHPSLDLTAFKTLFGA